MIIKEKFGKFTKIKILNEKTREYVSIIPEYGANVNELVLKKTKKNKHYSIIEGDKDYNSIIKNEWFRGAKLTPFPNRIKDGKYEFNGKIFCLPINHNKKHHAIHGLIYNKKFAIVNEYKNSIRLKYSYNKEYDGYPFIMDIIINYKLSKGFECKTTIINLSNENIPIGDGWHPYFTLTKNSNIDDCSLKIPSDKLIIVDERMIPTGKIIKFNKFLKSKRIGKEIFDSGFIITKSMIKNKNYTRIAETILSNKEQDNLDIIIWQETGKNKYNYLQIFIPPSRKSVAIEPMTCSTDAFNNKHGLIILEPGKKFMSSYGVYIR